MKSSDPPLIFEQIFDVDKTALWNAITEVDQMRQWFFKEIPAFNPIEGFETSFMITSPEREFPHAWKIIEVVPETRIVYDWRYDGYEGVGKVCFELYEDGVKTRLVLTSTTIEDWQEDIPEFKQESAEGGWNYFIKQSLKTYVESL